ncbi:MAG: DUF736 family protein [Patescibacteria group bacterium]|nr:DUF736 family protein [Patescibacteria group bacterium]
MSTIGFFKPQISAQTKLEGFLGEINSQLISGRFALKPVDGEKRSDDSPDFEVLIERRGSQGFVPWGIAWRKKPAGKKSYISILLTPESGQDLNVAAFPPDDPKKDDRWVIVRGRPRGGSVGADARAALPSDEIPY